MPDEIMPTEPKLSRGGFLKAGLTAAVAIAGEGFAASRWLLRRGEVAGRFTEEDYKFSISMHLGVDAGAFEVYPIYTDHIFTPKHLNLIREHDIRVILGEFTSSKIVDAVEKDIKEPDDFLLRFISMGSSVADQTFHNAQVKGILADGRSIFPADGVPMFGDELDYYQLKHREVPKLVAEWMGMFTVDAASSAAVATTLKSLITGKDITVKDMGRFMYWESLFMVGKMGFDRHEMFRRFINTDKALHLDQTWYEQLHDVRNHSNQQRFLIPMTLMWLTWTGSLSVPSARRGWCFQS